MAWNNNNLSDSQYVKQLRYYQSTEEMGELKKEIKKIKNSHRSDSKNKKKGVMGRILGIFRIF